jgi:hypothetical protein
MIPLLTAGILVGIRAATHASGSEFSATTTGCHVADTTTWMYPRGQILVCDLLSDQERVAGRLTLYEVCPVVGATNCGGTFLVQARASAQWEGTYQVMPAGEGAVAVLHAEGRGTGNDAGARVVLDIHGLESGPLWDGDYWSVSVVGTILNEN